MPYATITMVQQHLPQRWRDDAELSARIGDVQTAAEEDVDRALSVKYVVPVSATTSPLAYVTVQRLCARLIAARALKLHRAIDAVETAWYARDLEKEVLSVLTEFAEGNGVLPDDAVLNECPAGLDVHDGFDGMSASEQAKWLPWFTRGDKW
jgi:hypothetical protein